MASRKSDWLPIRRRQRRQQSASMWWRRRRAVSVLQRLQHLPTCSSRCLRDAAAAGAGTGKGQRAAQRSAGAGRRQAPPGTAQPLGACIALPRCCKMPSLFTRNQAINRMFGEQFSALLHANPECKRALSPQNGAGLFASAIGQLQVEINAPPAVGGSASQRR